MVHVAGAQDNNLFQWNIGGLINNGAQFDIIGMSLYPDVSNWISMVDDAYANMLAWSDWKTSCILTGCYLGK